MTGGFQPISVSLFDGDGALVGTDEGVPSSGKLTYQLEAGTYYIRVSPYIPEDERDRIELGRGYSILITTPSDEDNAGGVCDRTEAVRTQLVGMLAFIYDCAAATGADLGTLTGNWYLQHAALGELTANDFGDLSGLGGLYLDHNDLTSLPEGVFDDLSRLKVLSLTHNDLASLPDGVFDNLTGLRGLYLGNNNLSSLPDGIFNNLSNLEVLSLVSNDLTSLPDGVFDNLLNLRELYVGDNNLGSLPDDLLEGLSYLEVLSFSDEPPTPLSRTGVNRGYSSGLPVIGGTAAVDMTLTARTSGINHNCWNTCLLLLEFTYQWIQVDGTTETDIVGATAPTYRPTTADVGKTVKVRVSYTDDSGNGDTLTSLASPVIVSEPAGGNAGICSRQPKVRTAILAKLPDISDCGQVTASDLSDITGGMRLGSTRWIGELRASDFAGLSNLQKMEIHGVENLTTLPDGVFQDLSSLESLYVGSAGLTEVHPSALDGLSNLQLLRLTANHDLHELPVGVFDNLPNLQKLYLWNNRLTSLPDGVFDDLSSVQILRLESNELTSLPDGVFDDLSSLHTLWLNGNEIASLPGGVFNELTNLRYLHLYGNELASLPDGVFDDLTNLHTLFLNDNEIGSLQDGVFNDLTSLVFLYLKNNNLTALPDGAFDGMNNLRILRLSHNEIVSLPDGVFDDLSNLRELYLNYNELASLPDGVFGGLSNLQKLEIYDNELTYLPDGVLDNLSNLQVLHAAYNYLITLPEGAFNDLANLELLSLDNSDLTSLPAGTFEGMYNLERLYLEDNPGAPFVVETVLEQQGSDTMVVRVDKGAPFDMEVTLSAQGGRLSTDASTSTTVTVVVEAGNTTSEPVTVVLNAEQTEVTTSLQSATFIFGTHEGVQISLAGNTPATGIPTISGTAQVGETLTAETSGIEDADGLNNAVYTYQWLADDADIAGATSASYTPADTDEGKTIRVRVSFGDDRNHQETSTSDPTAAVEPRPNSPATGAPTISGTAQVGETLTASTSGINDADGLSGAVSSYQWIANDGSTDTEIPGATTDTYTLATADVGQTIKVRVTFIDDKNNPETLTSAPTATVGGAATVPGEPEHLNVSPHDAGALDLYWEAPGSDGGSPITGYKVQWKEAADSWDTEADVSEETATGTTYTITGLTDGVEYAVRIIATNDAGDGPPSDEATGTPRETTPPVMTEASVRSVKLETEASDINSHDEPVRVGSVTVEVTEDDTDPDDVTTSLTVTWRDAKDCSSEYNAYFATWLHGVPGTEELPDELQGYRIHLGSATSDASQNLFTISSGLAPRRQARPFAGWYRAFFRSSSRVGGTFPARRKTAPPPIASAALRRCASHCVSPPPPTLPAGSAPQRQRAPQCNPRPPAHSAPS